MFLEMSRYSCLHPDVVHFSRIVAENNAVFISSQRVELHAISPFFFSVKSSYYLAHTEAIKIRPKSDQQRLTPAGFHQIPL